MTQAIDNPGVDAALPHRAGHACTHCSLPVPDGLYRSDRQEQFCCRACESAYEVIHGCGLDAYYRLREQQDEAQAPATRTDDPDRLSVFDTPKFNEMYVRDTEKGRCAADLILQGVHCAACVWLVEKLPRVVPGVIEARLSLRQATVRIVWDPAIVKLSAIAKALSTLGYAPHPARGSDKQGIHLAEQRAMLVRIGVAGALAGNTMLLALALYTGLFSGMEDKFANFFRWISAGLGLLALAWPGRVFFHGAWAALRTRSPRLDLPIALALGVGGVAGGVNVVMGRGDIYFDSLTVLVFLLLVGRFIQYRQQRRADEAVGLLFSLTPTHCRRVTQVGDRDSIEQIPVEALSVGDVIEVRSGELIPADGQIICGSASIIAALITGESRPVAAGIDDEVCAGARVSDATVRIRVTAIGEASRVGRLMALVQEGMTDKPALIAMTDRIAGWFVCALTVIAIAVFAGWCTVDLGLAIDHTVALLIIACPCALGLATPLTLAVALGRAAKQDILIKSGVALDRLARPGRLLIDKTGTITRGQMRVEAWHGEQSLAPLIAEVQQHATHPIARAIVEHFGGTELSAQQRAGIRDVQVHPTGVSAQTAQGTMHIGSASFLAGLGIQPTKEQQSLADQWSRRACTPVFVALNNKPVAFLAVGDALQDNAKSVIGQLRHWGWRVQMLSGDHPAVARQVGQAVGLSEDDIEAGATPEDKRDRVRCAVGDEPVVMIGDGVNDAAALAAADVGIAVRGGAEASMTIADVYLARPGLDPLVDLMKLARRCRQGVFRTLVVSLLYNALAVSLAAAGLINPLVAAILMPASSMLVLALAMQGQGMALRNPSPPEEVP